MDRILKLAAWFFSILLCEFFFLKEAEAQCGDTQVGCQDCISTCPLLISMCDNVKTFCRKTCKACVSESVVCQQLGCDHNCSISENAGELPTCSCFPGYTLDIDGHTCNDINECLSDTTCSSPLYPTCINTPGSYTCSGCAATKGLWKYYERPKCCKRNARRLSQCGFSSTNGRIIKGKLASVARWPWTAYIYGGDQRCSGSLITREWILTTADCVNLISSSDTTVVLGALNTTEQGNVHKQIFRVKRTVEHPNNLALVQLNGTAKYSRYVGTICLPNGHEPAVGEKCYATGYKSSQYRGTYSGALREADLPIVRNQLCEEDHADSSNRFNHELQLCAGHESGGKNECQGNSGGPLVCQRCDSCDWYLAGIRTSGSGCGRPGFYGVFTRVRNYEEWIARITGLEYEQRTCLRPRWHEWGPWTECTASCGRGKRSRARSCLNGRAGEPDCLGNNRQSVDCNTNDCQGEWGDWAECSQSCGQGTQSRSRASGGDRENRRCSIQQCPTWAEWQTFSECSSSCNIGERILVRACNTYGAPEGRCDGESTRTEPCNEQPCPRWSEYGSWTNCTRSCGGGTQHRNRSCVFGEIGQNGCVGEEIDMKRCSTQQCPTWAEWQTFSECSSSCNTGERILVRACNTYGAPEGRCDGESTRTEPCNEQPCPRWSEYGSWTNCTRSCGGGTQQRNRSCVFGEIGQNGCVGEEIDMRRCSIQQCPTWAEWQTFSECSSSCNTGERILVRACNTYGAPEGRCDGESTRTEPCNEQPCPRWSEYGSWTNCTRSCGGGTQHRNRSCVFGEIGQNGCVGEEIDMRACNSQSCQFWSEWGKWGLCSASCGGGIRAASRTCVNGNAMCRGDNRKYELCGTQICQDLVSQWGEYKYLSNCSKACGGGVQLRFRECLHGGIGGDGCRGDSLQSIDCNTSPCPEWGPFGEFNKCSQSCGGGTRQRTRSCIGGEVGSGLCVGSSTDEEQCNTVSCQTGICLNYRNKLDDGLCAIRAPFWCSLFHEYMRENCPLACCNIRMLILL